MLAQTKVSSPKLELQLELEHLFNKNQLLPRIRQEFTQCTAFDFVAYMAEHEIPEAFGLDLLIQMVLHKRTTLSVLVGILRKHFEPSIMASQMAADMLYHCAEVDLVSYDEVTERFIIEFDIDADAQEEIVRYQYPLPMVVEPETVTSNSENGYLTTPGSIILRKNHHNEDVCLDHINRMNRIRFTLDDDTAFMIANEWRNLDKPKEGESREDYFKRVKAFEKYDTVSKEVIKEITSLGNEFYLTHKYDKRGRSYCQGYHVNYQGTSWNKAVVQLLDKEFVE